MAKMWSHVSHKGYEVWGQKWSRQKYLCEVLKSSWKTAAPSKPRIASLRPADNKKASHGSGKEQR